MKTNIGKIHRTRRTRLTLVGLYAIGVAVACTTRTFGPQADTKEQPEQPSRTAEPSRTAPPGSSENDGPVIDEKLYESAPTIAPSASPKPKK